jgi:hypothetical protein
LEDRGRDAAAPRNPKPQIPNRKSQIATPKNNIAIWSLGFGI